MLMSFSLTGLESPLPCLLVTYAREAHLRLAERPITRREPMLALLLTVTAGEAVVNRLLEPLVSEQDWGKLERRGSAQKWVRLADELGLVGQIAEGNDPLAGFLKVVAARHSIVHFKHGPNLQSLTATPLEVVPGQAITVSMSELKPQVLGMAEDALDRTKATLYYPSLEKLVRRVLDAYEVKQPGIVLMLRNALDGKVNEMPMR